MGSWSVCCGISNIAITSGRKCVLLPLKTSVSEYRKYQPATLPIFGEYDDYGGIENIEKDDNTELIEKYFGVSIEQFCEYLLNGKFTYERDEAIEIGKKIKHVEEVGEYRFMWIDRPVYDFVKVNLNDHEKGHLDLGTPEMMKLLGFELIMESTIAFKNYEPKRFNKLYKKGDVEFFSDGKTLLKNDQYVYYVGKGGYSSANNIENYIELPEELNYLKNSTKRELWRLMNENDRIDNLIYILGSRNDSMILKYNKLKLGSKYSEELFHILYYKDFDSYGDRLVEMTNVSYNLHPMSGEFKPYEMYLTPQCGEFERHQKMLDKFAEINKTYIWNENN